MSIAHFDPLQPTKAPVPLATSSSPEKFAVYDNEVTPTYSLEASLQGSPWTVDAFYSQILGIADVPKELDLNLQPAFQHYEKIELLELLVTSTLASSHDPKTQMMTTVGEAIVYSFLRPNVGDYFIATANIGRKALFKVDEVSRATHEKESIHRVRYSLISELTAGNPLWMNLEKKVSVVKVFSKARLIENLNPVIFKDRFINVRRLGGDFRAMANDYWRNFYRPERGSLFMPGQDSYIYDPFLTVFFNSIVDSNTVTERQNMIFLSEDNDPVYDIKNIWSVLRTRGIENLTYAEVKMKLVTPAWFNHVSLSHSAFFANTDHMVYPDEFDRSSDIQSKPQWSVHHTPGFHAQNTMSGKVEPFDPKPTMAANGQPVDTALHTMDVGGVPYPLWNNVVAGDNYIFKPEFFQELPTSILEIALLDYIRRDAINLDQLMALIKHYPKMPRLEQFYYGPMIMVLIQEAIRGAYA